MKRVFKSNRAALRLATAATAAAVSIIATQEVRADAPVFDNMTGWLYSNETLGPNFGLYFNVPNPNPATRPPDSPIAGTTVGEAYNLPTGTTSLTGIDFTFANGTNDDYFNVNDPTSAFYNNSSPSSPTYNPATAYTFPGYQNGAGTTFNALKLTVSIYGAVTPVSMNSSGGYVGLSSSHEAFTDLLATEVFTDTVDTTPPAGYVYYFSGYSQGLDGIVPGLKFGNYNNANGVTTGPVNVTGLSTIGITYDLQGSTDGGLTYSHVAGFTPIVAADDPAEAGSTVLDAFYENNAGEVDNNFTQGPHYYEATYNNSDGTQYTAAVPNQAPSVRVFGVAPGIIYNWANAANGNYNDSTQWNPNGVPAGNDTAVFNLGSTAGYTVEVSDFETAYNLNVLNDTLAINLDAEFSYLYVQNAMTVGQATSTSTPVKGNLTLENNNGTYIGELEANSVTIGGNGSTGSITVTSNTYFVCDNVTTINAGSKLVVQSFGKFDSDTLSIAGTTNAWLGQLDIGYDSTDLFDGNLATVTNQLKQGFNGGKWNGSGIISSVAASDTTHLTAVGAILNNDGKGNPIYSNTSSGGLGVFDGANPPITAVLLRYTYYGDANLDGTVDGSDYSLVDNGFLNHLSGWYNGDFNYDGVVNGSDYTLMDNAYNQQYGPVFEDLFDTNGADIAKAGEGASASDGNGDDPSVHLSDIPYSIANASPNLSVSITAQIAAPASPTAVPEPTSLGLLGMAAVSMLSRRSRRNLTHRATTL